MSSPASGPAWSIARSVVQPCKKVLPILRQADHFDPVAALIEDVREAGRRSCYVFARWALLVTGPRVGDVATDVPLPREPAVRRNEHDHPKPRRVELGSAQACGFGRRN